MEVTQSHTKKPQFTNLAQRETPIHPISERFHQLLHSKEGPRIFVKRDDLTECTMSGNKVRKLEYILQDAQQKQSSIVITCGALQSNHTRATAIAAARKGMKAYVLLKSSDGRAPSKNEGNVLLTMMVGAKIKYCAGKDYSKKDRIMQQMAQEMKDMGETPYIIPQGGSSLLGLWGHIDLMEEVKLHQEKNGEKFSHIVCAVGTGGTLAGLILGRLIHNMDIEIIGVPIWGDAPRFRKTIDDHVSEFMKHYQLIDPSSEGSSHLSIRDYHLLDGYAGRGYSIPYDAEIQWAQHLAMSDGIILDHSYTGIQLEFNLKIQEKPFMDWWIQFKKKNST